MKTWKNSSKQCPSRIEKPVERGKNRQTQQLVCTIYKLLNSSGWCSSMNCIAGFWIASGSLLGCSSLSVFLFSLISARLRIIRFWHVEFKVKYRCSQSVLVPLWCSFHYSVLPSFQPVPVSRQKNVNYYFRWDFNFSSTEAICQKNKHLRYQLMVLVGFLVEKRANMKGFCSGE